MGKSHENICLYSHFFIHIVTTVKHDHLLIVKWRIVLFLFHLFPFPSEPKAFAGSYTCKQVKSYYIFFVLFIT